MARLFQGCSLIAIIGMTANFIAKIVSSNGSPPSILIGTITVVSHHFTNDYLCHLTSEIDLHSSDLLYYHLDPPHRQHPPFPRLRHLRHPADGGTDSRRNNNR